MVTSTLTPLRVCFFILLRLMSSTRAGIPFNQDIGADFSNQFEIQHCSSEEDNLDEGDSPREEATEIRIEFSSRLDVAKPSSAAVLPRSSTYGKAGQLAGLTPFRITPRLDPLSC